jgi:uncharacterized protein YggE
MNRPVLLAVASLVLFAGCVTPIGANGAADGATTVSVSATGTVSTDPDRAVVQASVEQTADTADAARERVAADVGRVRTALDEAGVPADAVTTDGYGVGPVYGEGRDPVGYRATHVLAVETTPDEAGTVVDAAVGNGATRVDGVRFTLSDERRTDLRATAVDRAMAAARTDADTVAATADRSVTGVESVRVGADVSDGPFARGGEADASATRFDPGPVSVTATVDVTYRA